MRLQEILAASGGVFFGEAALLSRPAASVTIDSRTVKKDSLFIALRGERANGHTFIPSVFAGGGLCAVGEEALTPPAGHAYIRVASSEKALRDIAAHYRSTLPVKVVGITGSVGKTSTKEAVAAVLFQKYRVLKTEGNLNNEIGLPLTVLRLRASDEVAVLEMGINHFGEMSRLAAIARPDIGVITNIGTCHLEFLGDRRGVMKAKTEMFDFLNPHGRVVLNGDDDFLSTIDNVHGKKPFFFGFSPDCSCRAEDVRPKGLAGTACTIVLPDGRFPVSLPVPGAHAVPNALAACAVGSLFGVTKEAMAAALSALTPLAGRGNIEHTPHFTLINDCYNANPVSLQASLQVLAAAKGRKVAVLGDMGELGEEEETLHYACGVFAANAGIDLLLCAGKLSGQTAAGAKSAGKDIRVLHFETAAALTDSLPSLLKDGDTVLIKASHAAHFERVAEACRAL